MPKGIKYKKGYKYQLACTYITKVNICPRTEIRTEYLNLSTQGFLGIKKGYCWDGPSGLTVDTKTFMRGSLIHDALYQLMREKHLDQDRRIEADRELYRMCREDGMNILRAQYVYYALRIFGSYAASWEGKRKIVTAP